jgi:hypothetical protein
MKPYIAWIAAVLFCGIQGAFAKAQVVMSPVALPVDHPLVADHPVRTAGTWRKGIGEFGESFADGTLKLRGYRVTNIKLPSNHGVDRVAVKYNASGKLIDVRLVEVKAHYGKGKPRLGMTKNGQQMSRKWLADWFRKLRSTGKVGILLAREISVFRKVSGIPLERLGEVHDINLRSGTYTIRNPMTLAERGGPMSIQRELNELASRSRSPAAKTWAHLHLTQLEPLHRTRMRNWMSLGQRGNAFVRVTSTRVAVLEARQALRGARRVLVGAAGLVGTAVAVALDAYEIYGHVRDYRSGNLSRREFVTAIARSGGGITGAGAGVPVGAWVGAQLGALGGPLAPITVPAGVVIGAGVGGVAGYFGGSYVGETAAAAWYKSLDKNVRRDVNRWLAETPTPLGN